MYKCQICGVEYDYGSMAEILPEQICVNCNLLQLNKYYKCEKCGNAVLKTSDYHMCIRYSQDASDHPLKKYRFN